MQSSEPHDAGVGVGAILCELTIEDDWDTVNVLDAGHDATYEDDEAATLDEDADADDDEAEDVARFS